MAITEKIVFVASDGTEFDNRGEAALHDAVVIQAKDDHYFKFIISTYNGQRLLQEHKLDEEGTWEVRGEDPNCDFGGHHHEPYLGTFSGTLENVIRKAVTLDRFWEWGYGGSIRKVEIQPIEKV